MAINSVDFAEVFNTIEARHYDDHRGNFFDVAFVPDPDDNDYVSTHEDDVLDANDTDEDLDEDDMIGGKNKVMYEAYNGSQYLLKENHSYKWVNGKDDPHLDSETKVFLPDKERCTIDSMSKTEIYELFFSEEVKNVVITASKEHDLNILVAK